LQIKLMAPNVAYGHNSLWPNLCVYPLAHDHVPVKFAPLQVITPHEGALY